jgi:hypothetical protein
VALLRTVDGPVDVDRASFEIDVFPFERLKLTGARVEVHGERD